MRRLSLVAPCLFAMLSLAARGAAQNEPRFPRMAFDGLGTIGGIDSGDIDEDGDLDVVFALANSADFARGIAVLPADGMGGFLAPSIHDVGIACRDVAVVDFDGDGHLDVLAPGHEADVLLQFRGDGTGAFAAPELHPSGSEPWDIELGDVDVDGTLDVALVNFTPKCLRTLLGDGIGGFAASVFTLTPEPPVAVGLGDFDEDGLPDAAVVEHKHAGRWWKGLGDGTYDTPIVLDPLTSNTSLLVMDVTGDGHLDIVDRDIRIGDGRGGFTVVTPLLPGGTYGRIAAGDLTGDGHTDILIGTKFHTTVALVPGDGAGGFGPTRTLPVTTAVQIHVADLDGDGIDDAVVGGHYSSTTPPDVVSAEIIFGRPLDGLDLPYASEVSGVSPAWQLADGDFDSDGRPDLLATSDAALVFLRGNGLGDFTATNVWTPPGSAELPHALGVGDMNGDGRLDAVIGTSQALKVRVLLGDGAGNFELRDSEATPKRPHDLALGDLDLDGMLDVVVASEIDPEFASFRGIGAGRIDPGTLTPALTAVEDIELFDADLDGVLDALVGAVGLGELDVHRGDGTGGFLAPLRIDLDAGDARRVTILDVDDDGFDDVVVMVDSSPLITVVAPRLQVVLSDGLGGLSLGGTFPVENAAWLFGSADIDQDGHDDILLSGFRLVGVASSDGQGGLGDLRFHGSAFVSYLSACDVNGDAYPDLIALGPASDADLTRVVSTSLNAFGPLGRLGGALAGVDGEPVLSAQGTLQSGTDLQLHLAHAAPSSFATLVLGLDLLGAPFKQGVLVPTPDVLVGGLPTSSAGGLDLTMTWGAGVPSGLVVTLQSWIADASAPAGFSASNGLTLTQP